MSEIRNALTRKLGPLPAWAWALIGGAALFAYRARQGAGTPTVAAATTDTTTPGITDNTAGLKDPVSLAPGESVYDPNTGHLIGAAPEQQPANVPTPQSPITLEPGETLYDPNTGRLLGAAAAPVAATKKKAKKRAKVTKRTPKAKPHHTTTKSTQRPAAKSHGKRHGLAALVGKRVSAKYKPAPKSPKPRAIIAHPKATPRARARAASHPAIRQRPAAPHVTHPATQRTTKHPARVAARRRKG